MNRKIKVRCATTLLCVVLLFSFTTFIGAIEVESVTVNAAMERPSQNYAPIAENLNYTTYRDVSICGNFLAVDPEGDLISFRLVTQPKKGSVQISEGSFVYTPNSGKKGKDSFTYEAVDMVGNASAPATVSIVIEKQATKICYTDMSGNEAHYSALKLAEEGVFIGQQINGEYYFSPTQTVTRGEFLTMCAAISGINPISDITRTGFADDSDMPTWVKPYVSAALLSGIVNGYVTHSGSVVFNAAAPITQAEAAVMLNNTLGVTNVRSSNFKDEASMPTWAYQAASNLSACRIIPDISLTSNQTVTRAQAAEMLSSAMELLNSREIKNSLLGWAR